MSRPEVSARRSLFRPVLLVVEESEQQKCPAVFNYSISPLSYTGYDVVAPQCRDQCRNECETVWKAQPLESSISASLVHVYRPYFTHFLSLPYCTYPSHARGHPLFQHFRCNFDRLLSRPVTRCALIVHARARSKLSSDRRQL